MASAQSPKRRSSSGSSKRKHASSAKSSSGHKHKHTHHKSAAPPVIPERPATLTLPEQWNSDPDRFEFWSLRVPQNISLDQMVPQIQQQPLVLPSEKNNKNKSPKKKYTATTATTTLEQPIFHVDQNNNNNNNETSTSTTTKTPYTLQFGHAAENEGLCLLVPRSWIHPHDDDDDDDDNENGTHSQQHNNDTNNTATNEPYVPVPWTRFRHHLQVVQHTEPKGERILAPPPDEAPPAPQLRPAYTPVPQKTGLKRRWHPLGCADKEGTLQDQQTQTLDPPSSRHRKRSHPLEEDDKRARKAAKKARKESKKAKKEHKKRRSSS